MKRDTTSPIVDEKLPKKQAANEIAMAGEETTNSDILQKLLAGQERISNDLRDSLDRQCEFERNADTAKANLFSLTCKVSEIFANQE